MSAEEYEARCAEAATAQGLDPVSAALTAADVPFTVEQTGGFCMVVQVPRPSDDRFVWITTAEEEEEGTYLCCVYEPVPDEEYDDEIGAETLNLADAVDFAIHFLAS